MLPVLLNNHCHVHERTVDVYMVCVCECIYNEFNGSGHSTGCRGQPTDHPLWSIMHPHMCIQYYPLYVQEVYESGEGDWKENRECLWKS